MTPSKAFVAIVVLALALGGNLGSAAQAADPAASREAAAEFIETLGEKVLAIQASEPAAMAEPRRDALRNLIRVGCLRRTTEVALCHARFAQIPRFIVDLRMPPPRVA